MSKQRVAGTGRGVGSDRVPWRVALPTVVVFLVIAGSQATAQKPYPIFKLNALVDTMKMAERNFGGANTSLANNDFATAKAQVTRAREQLAITITFWRDNKKDDAIRRLGDTIAKMDHLDAALPAEKVDATAASALAKQVGAACESCHAVYREQDPTTKTYRLKLG